MLQLHYSPCSDAGSYREGALVGKSAKVFREVVQDKRKVKGGLETIWRVRIRHGNHVIVAATLADEYSAQVQDVAETIATAVETAMALEEGRDTALARISELMNGDYSLSKLRALNALMTTRPVGKKQRSNQRSQRRHHSSPRRDRRR